MAGSGQIGPPRAPLPWDIGKHSLLDPLCALVRRRALGLYDEVLDTLEVPPKVHPAVSSPLASTSPLVRDGVTMGSSYFF